MMLPHRLADDEQRARAGDQAVRDKPVTPALACRRQSDDVTANERHKERASLTMRNAAIRNAGHTNPAPLDVTEPVAGPYRMVGKRLLDVVVSLSLILFLSPLLLVIALAVRLDGGPATYGHQRVGRHGRAFRCLKFRSMCVDSAEKLTELLANDPQAREEWETTRKLRNDPRVTRVGRVLRATSLDELPQIFCVLAGTMSLIGPRPVVQAELDRYYGEAALDYMAVRPGITGLWQVSGRSNTSYPERVRLDRAYVRDVTLMNDLRIAWRTLGVVLNRSGAY